MGISAALTIAPVLAFSPLISSTVFLSFSGGLCKIFGCGNGCGKAGRAAAVLSDRSGGGDFFGSCLSKTCSSGVGDTSAVFAALNDLPRLFFLGLPPCVFSLILPAGLGSHFAFAGVRICAVPNCLDIEWHLRSVLSSSMMVRVHKNC